MLYVNNKFINLLNPESEHYDIVKDYNSRIAKLRDRFGRYVTAYSRVAPKVNIIKGKPGLNELYPADAVPVRVAVKTPKGGTEEWIYSDTALSLKDGILQIESSHKIIQHGEVTFDLDADPDWAYFFLFKTNRIERGFYYIYDKDKIEQDKAEKRSKEARLNGIIYDPDSPLYRDEVLLKLLAKRWGIPEADKLDKDAIRNKLYDIITEGEKKGKGRGMEEFIADVRRSTNDEGLKIAATVRDAIDRRILVFDPITRVWEIDYQDGNTYKVVGVSIQDNAVKDDVVIATFTDDKHVYAMLQNALGGKKDVKGAVDVVEDSIGTKNINDIEDMAQLRRMLKSLGVNSFGMNKEKMKQAILKAMEKQPAE